MTDLNFVESMWLYQDYSKCYNE